MKRWICMLLCLMCAVGILLSCGRRQEDHGASTGETGTGGTVDFSSDQSQTGHPDVPKNTFSVETFPHSSQPEYTVPVQPPTSTVRQEAS